jgi:hypothetical protein
VRADFKSLPYPDACADVLVLDPPYIPWVTADVGLYEDAYRNAETTQRMTYADIIGLYADGMSEAKRVLRRGGRLMVKGMDVVNGGKQRWAHRDVPAAAERLGFKLKDMAILANTKQPPSNPRQKSKQQHLRKAHSFLWVFTIPRLANIQRVD